MTLGEAKDKVIKLMDEYSSGGNKTTDKDINLKMNAFFDAAQRNMATIKRIQRRYVVPLHPPDNGEKYIEYPAPDDFYMPLRLWADYETISIGKWIGKSLVLPAGETRRVELEYFAYPAPITEETPDSYEFEIDPDAQECMPYWVAAQQLVVDLVVDYRSLLAIYDRMVATLNTAIPGPTATVKVRW